MKVTVCDACKKEGKLVETNHYFSVKGHRELKLDVCARHNDEVKKLSMLEYIKLTYSITGSDLTDDDIIKMYPNMNLKK